MTEKLREVRRWWRSLGRLTLLGIMALASAGVATAVILGLSLGQAGAAGPSIATCSGFGPANSGQTSGGTSGNTFTLASGSFTTTNNPNVGAPFTGPGVPAGTTITAETTTTLTLSTTVTTEASPTTFYIGGSTVDVTLSSQSTASKPIVVGANGSFEYTFVATGGSVDNSCTNAPHTGSDSPFDDRIYTNLNIGQSGSSSQYVQVDDSTGQFASSVTCADTFQANFDSSSASTVQVFDDTTNTATGDDTVAVSGAPNGGQPLTSVLLSEAGGTACTTPTLTTKDFVSATPVTVIVSGQSTKNANVLDLSAGTATLAINGETDPATSPGAISATTFGTVSGLSGGVPVQFGGEGIVLGPHANTTYDPGVATGLSFAGATSVVNTVDLTTEDVSLVSSSTTFKVETGATSVAPCAWPFLTGAVSAGGLGGTDLGQAGNISGTSPTFSADCFSNVSQVNGAGSSTRSTTLAPVVNCPLPAPPPSPPTLSVFFQGNNASAGGTVVAPYEPATCLSFPTVNVAANANNSSSVANEGTVVANSVTTATFAGVDEVDAPTNAPETFQPDTASCILFAGNAGQNDTLDLSNETSATFGAGGTFSVQGKTSGSCGGTPVGQVSSTGTVTVSDTFDLVTTILGSPLPTTFAPAPCDPVVLPVPTFVGGDASAGGSVLDLTGIGATTGGLTVDMNADSSGSKGAVTDTSAGVVNTTFANFYAVNLVKGSSSVATDFRPDGAPNINFQGGSGTSVLDLSQQTASETVVANANSAASPGTASTPSGTTFSNITTVLGGSIGTNYQPGFQSGTSTGPNFVGYCSVAVNANLVDLGTETNAPLKVDSMTDNGGSFPTLPANLPASGSGSAASYNGCRTGVGTNHSAAGVVHAGNYSDAFFNVTEVKGATGIGTDFQPGSTVNADNLTLVGQGSGPNRLDLVNETSNYTVDMVHNDFAPGAPPVTTAQAAFQNITEVDGSPDGTTLQSVSNCGSAQSAIFFQGNDASAPGSVLAPQPPLAGCAAGSPIVNVLVNSNATGSSSTLGQLVSNGVTSATFAGVTAVDARQLYTDADFQPGSVGGVQFVGTSARNDTLDLTNEQSGTFGSHGAFSVQMSSSACTTPTGPAGQVQASGAVNFTDTFIAVSTVLGSPLPTTFFPAACNPTPVPVVTFVGGDVSPGGSVVDLSGIGSVSGGLTVDLNGDNSTNKGQVADITAGTPNATFANFYSVNQVNGSNSLPTDFRPDSATSVAMVGGGAAAVLDLSEENPTSANVVNVNSNNTTSPGTVSTLSGDTFSNFTTVLGAFTGTSFQPGFQSGTATGPNFVGICTPSQIPNVVDLSNESAAPLTVQNMTSAGGSFPSLPLSLTAAMNSNYTGCRTSNQAAAGQVQAVNYTVNFFNVTQIKGSTSIATDFQPGSTIKADNLTFIGQGSGPNRLDLTGESGHYTVDMPNLNFGPGVPGSFTIQDAFQGINEVDGSLGGTAFEGAAAGGVTFIGNSASTSNELDLPSLSSLLTVAVNGDNSAAPGLVTGTNGSGFSNDTFQNIETLSGNPGTGGTFFEAQQVALPITYRGAGQGINAANTTLSFVQLNTASAALTVDANANNAVLRTTVGSVSEPATSTTVSVSSGGFPGVVAGMTVSGSNIPGGTTVLNVAGNSLTLSAPTTNTTATSDTLTFTSVVSGVTEPAHSTTVTVASGGFPGVATGMTVSGANIAAGTTVSGVAGNTLTLSNATTNSSPAGATLSFLSVIGSVSGINVFAGCSSPAGCFGSTFLAAAGSVDTFLGAGATNTLNFNAITSGAVSVTENFNAGTASLPNNGSVTFSNVQTFLGTNSSPSPSDIFTVGAGSANFVGYGGSDEVTFASDNPGITFRLGTPVNGHEVTNVQTANGTDSVQDVPKMIGSSSGTNTFFSNGYGGHTFQAGATGNVLDLGSVPVAETGIIVDAAQNCSPLPDCVTHLAASPVANFGSGTTDAISGMQTYNGAPGGTIFQANATTTGLKFNGNVGSTIVQNDILDLTNSPSGTAVQDTACNGTVINGSNLDTFQDIAQFIGSNAGGTTFVASPTTVFGQAGCSGPSAITFQGEGSGNKLDMSSLNTDPGSGGTPACVIAEWPPGAAQAPVCGSVSQPGGGPGVVSTSTELETFSGIQQFTGSSEGNTTFVTGTVGGLTFTGQGADNFLSFQNIPPGGTGGNGVQVFLDPNAQGQETAVPGSGTDIFTGITNIDGSPSNDTFAGGPGTFNINGEGGNDTLTYDSGANPAPNPVNVTLAAGVGNITGGFGGTTTTIGVRNFVGGNASGNIFTTDAYGGYAFTGPGGTTNNSLSFANVSQSVLTTGLNLAITSSAGNGSATGLLTTFTGSGTDNFQGIQAYTGSPNADSFTVGSGAFNIQGGNSGSNSLSFQPSPVAVTVNLSGSAQTATSSNNAVNDTISNFQSFTGASVGGNDFVASPNGGYTFAGGGPLTNTLDLSAAPGNIVISINGNSLANPGTVANLLGSNSQDRFSNIKTVIGSAQSTGGGATRVNVGCSGGNQFIGQGVGSVLAISFAPCGGTSAPTIDASTTPGTISSLPGGGGNDTFTGFSTFIGPSSGKTTFIAAGSPTSGLKFTGSGPGNAFDASHFPSGAKLDATSGVATLASSSTDTFSGVSCYVGSSSGGTTFVAPAGQLSNSGCSEFVTPPPNFLGTGTGNVLDLSAVVASKLAPVTVASTTGVVSTPAGQWDSFGSVQSIIGSSSGFTTFQAGSTGGFNFAGQTPASPPPTGNGNVLSFQSVPVSSGGVSVFLSTNNQGQNTANPGTGTDTFTGINNVIGSPGNDSFFGGPGNFTVTGNGGLDKLDDTAALSGANVSLTAGTATVSGAFSGQTTTNGIRTFIGSANGGNTFLADAYGGYTFQAPTGTLGNSLSFAGVEGGVGVTGITLSITSSAGNGGVTGLSIAQTGQGSDAFQGIQTYVGSPGSDTFNAGAGQFTLEGGPSGTNTLSLRNAPAGITFALAGTQQTATSSGGQVNDSISNFQTITGAAVGNNVFQAAAGGGYNLNGLSNANTLDLSATPAGVQASVGPPGQVTGLNAGVGPLSGNTVDNFTGMQIFIGSSQANHVSPTTFVAGCTGGLQFIGAGQATVLSVPLSACPSTPGPTINAAVTPGTVSGLPGGGGNDTFTNITEFDAPSTGDTTFIAPGGSVTGLNFVGGGGPGNTLDASAFSSGSTLDSTTGTATLGAAGSDTFSGISCFVGSLSGGTTFIAPSSALSASGCSERVNQPDYLAAGTGNVLDLGALPTTASNLTPGSATVTTSAVQVGSSTYGTFVDIQRFKGATTGYTTFQAGTAGGLQFDGRGALGTNGLDLTAAPRTTTVDTTSGTVTLGAGLGTLAFSDLGNFTGSGVGFTTFKPDALNTYTFNGGASTTGNTLDLSNAPNGVAVYLACPGTTETVWMTSAQVTPCTTPANTQSVTFSNVQNYIGSQFGNTSFASPSAGTGGLSFTGQGTLNSLSFAALPAGPGITVSLAQSTVAYPVWTALDTYSDIQTITGSPNGDAFQSGGVTMSLVGGGGSDTISFANANAPANITLASGGVPGVATGGFVSPPAQLSLTAIQNVVSSPFGGTVTGNGLPSNFTGGPGNDTFVATGGADVINGGGGTDTLDLSHATKFVTMNLGLSGPQVTGGIGVLTVVPGSISNLVGGNFGNRLIAGPGNVNLTGGLGTDWLQAGSGTDTLNAGTGSDTLVGGTGYDTMNGGAGSDTFIPGSGGGKIVDTAGVGTLNFALSTASVRVNISTTQYTAPNGLTVPPDQATGGGGATYLLSGLQNITGTNFGDILVGNSASNVITGGNGNNLIVGGGGGDTLTAGSGANRFITGSGNNTVIGGTGTNTIDYASATSAVNVNLAKNVASSNGFGGSDQLVNISNIIGSRHDRDVLTLGTRPGTIFAGSGNNDSLIGSRNGNSTMIGGSGSDTFSSLGPNDHMIGGVGDDTFLANNGFLDYMTGGKAYNIAFVSCLDVQNHSYTNIQEVHIPSGCTAGKYNPPPRTPTPTKRGHGPTPPIVRTLSGVSRHGLSTSTTVAARQPATTVTTGTTAKAGVSAVSPSTAPATRTNSNVGYRGEGS